MGLCEKLTQAPEVSVDKKYLIPIAVGVGVLVLVLIAGSLFMGGQENEGAAAAAAALAAAEGARRLRNASRKELDQVEDDADESNDRVEEIEKELVADMEDTDHTVDNTTLSDLIDSEEERLS
jgi:gas vesicle protein